MLSIWAALLCGWLCAAQPDVEDSELTTSGWKKYAENPIIGWKGVGGSVFDVSVLLTDNDTYTMWLSWRSVPISTIAIASSKDGQHWSDMEPVLSSDGEWEDLVNRPCVIFHQGKYHMWFAGNRYSNSSSIGYATSLDGISWQRLAQPVFVPQSTWEGPTVMNPAVIYDERTHCFKMWYSAGEQYEPRAIGYATSDDGIEWKRLPDPVFSGTGYKGDWDRQRAGVGQVLFLSGWYTMFYIGYSDIDHAAIGIARSRDGISAWVRYPFNPVIQPTPGTFDENACYKPAVVYDGLEWKLWYNGRSGNVERIGLATFSSTEVWPEMKAYT